MIDDRTPNLNFKLPHKDNDPYAADVDRMRETLFLIDVLLSNVAANAQAAVNEAIENLTGAAPAALDTIAELAARLGDDQSQITSIITLLSQKASAQQLADAVTALAQQIDAKADAAGTADRLTALEANTSEAAMVARIISYSGV